MPEYHPPKFKHPATGPNPAQGAAGPVRLDWQEPHGMGRLSFKIWFLTLITLGIYYFWGKTEVRQRLWNAIRINGQPLEYTGTGKELFIGFLIVTVLIFIPLIAYVIALQVIFGPDSLMANAGLIPLYLVFFYLTGVAIYRAQRYRLRRTRWRGIRGTMSGNPWRFGWTYFWTFLTLIPTLGWSSPWRHVKLARILTNDSMLGSRSFSMAASARPLLAPFALMWASWLLIAAPWIYAAVDGNGESALLALGLSVPLVLLALVLTIRYQVRAANYLTGQTRFDNARFGLALGTGSLIGLILTNLLITVFTLGIFAPVVQTRTARYIFKRLSIDGMVNFAAITQATDALERTGEGLAEAFDVDMF